MSKRVGVILLSLGLLLVLAAFLFVGYNLWDDRRAEASVEGVLDQLLEKIPDAPTSPSTPSNPPISTPSGGQEQTLPDWQLDPNREMPAVEIDGYRYIGTVNIPSISRELPVMETYSLKQMKKAPCRYAGSVYLGNMVICAHNYVSHFGRLKNLAPGDEVIFTDMDGNVFSYTVSKVETLAGKAVEEMKTGDWDLTLFTCNASGRSRITVRCVKKG